MKKLFKNIIVVGALLTATTGLFFAATPSRVYAEELSPFEKISLKVYCAFYSCEKPENQSGLNLNEFESLSLKTYCSFFDCAAGPNLVATNEDKSSAVISSVVNSSVDKVIKKINTNSTPRVTQTIQGAQGPRGLQGVRGVQGERGSQGPQGEQGIQGERGSRGSSGSDGTNGTDGVDGINGASMMNLGTGASINPTTNTISCLNDGEILQYDLGTDTWNCVTPTTGTDSQSLTLVGNLLSLTNGGSIDLSSFLDDTDTDTTYTAGNGIGLSGTTFAVSAPTCSGTQKLQWTGSAFVCSADVDTVLTESQVDAYANNNGYLTSEVDGSVTNELNTNVQLSGTNLLVTDAGGTFTVDLSSFLDDTDTDTTYTAGNGIGLSGTTFAVSAPTCSGTDKLQWTGSAFVCSADVDTVLTESQVDAYANNNGYLTSEVDGSVTNELNTNVQLSGTNLLVTDAGGTFTVDLSSFLDDTDTDTTYTAGNGIGLSGTTFAVSAPTCSGTDKLQWTGSAFVCSADVDTVLTESQVDAYANNNGYLTSEVDGSVTNELNTNVQLSGTNLLVTDAGGTFTVDLSSFLDDTDTDTTYTAGNGIGLSGTTFAVSAPTCSGTDKLQWTGSAFVCSADVDTVLTESQVDAYANNNGYLTSEVDGSVTNELNTNVQLSGTNLLVTDAGGTFTVDLSSFLDDTDTDTTYTAGNGIGLSGTTFAVSAPTCSGTDKLQWTGSAFVCSADVDTVLTESQVDAYANNNGYLTSEVDGSVTNELNTNVQLSGTNLLVTDAGGTFTVDLSSFLDDTDTDTTYTAGNGIGLSGTTFAVSAPTCSGTDKLQWTGSAFVCSADVDTVLTESQVDAYANNNGYLTSEVDGSVTNELNTNVQLSGTNLLVTDAGGTFTVDLSSFLDDTDTDTTYTAGNGIGLSGTTFAVSAPTCSGTDKLQWTGSAFVCSADVDTVLTESQVDAYANNNGYLTSEVDGSVTNELNTNVQLSGTNLLVTDAGGTFTVDLSSFLDDTDTDTTYTAGNGIGLSGTTFAVSAPTCSGTQKLQWTGSAFVCSADVDTVLTESQVDAYANNNGYLTSEVDGSVTNELNTNVQLSGTNLLVTDAGGTFTVDLSSFLDDTDTDTTYTAGNGIGLSGTTFAVSAPTCSGTDKLQWTGSAFVCSADVDTVLTESQVDAYANNNGYLTSEVDGSVTNELNTNVQLSGTNLLVTDAGGTFTVDLSSFLDDTDTDTTYTAGNGIGLSGTTFAVSAPTCSGTQKLQWTGSAFVCSADVDTVLTESQVDAYANNNGYLTSEVDGSVTNELNTNVQLSGTNLLVTDAGGTFTVDLSSFLDDTDTDTTYTAGNGIGLSGTTFAVSAPTCSGTDKLQWTGSAFVCSADVDTVLTESQVDAYANNNGYLTSEVDGSVTNELNTNVQLSGTNLLVTDAGGTFTVDLSSFLDDTDTDTTYTAGNGIGLSGTTFAVSAPTCSGTDKLQWTGSAFVCSADVDTNSGGTVTSVAASGGTTGLTFTGSPITSSGTLTLGGTLGLANGGTGATTAATARTNLGLGSLAILSAVTTTQITDGTIVNADVSATANIALSKLANGNNIVTSLGIPSGSNANGGSISANVLTLSLADGVNPGLVSTGTQTFAGDKTFNNKVFVNGATTFNNHPLIIRASGNDVLAFQDSAGITQWHWNLLGNGLNFVESNVADYRLFLQDGGNVGIGTGTPQATLHNAGSTILGAVSISNLATGGVIGTAAATVDAYTTFNVNQTTANQTLTLPNPTNATAGRIAYVNNVGSVEFTMSNEKVQIGKGRQYVWNGTAWSQVGDATGERMISKIKTANQTKTATTTLTPDAELQFNVDANEIWYFIFDIQANASTAGDLKISVTAPAGSTCSIGFSDSEGATSQDNIDCGVASQLIPGNNLADKYTISGTVTAGGTAGTIALNWAQFVASGSVIVYRGASVVAYRIGGADLAEVYYTDDSSISNGDIVALASTGVSQVKKTSIPYQTSTLGIISTKPGLVIGETDGTGKPVIVGLSGRVPVKVSNINGAIKPGDYITTSSISGVGMKATDPGQVIGKALTSLPDDIEQGEVIVFIQNSYFDGQYDIIEEGVVIPGNENLESNDSRTILENGSIADRLTHLVRRALERLSSIFIDFKAWIRELKAEKIETQELCVGNVCVTEQQFLKLFESNNIDYSTNEETEEVTEETSENTEDETSDENQETDGDTGSGSGTESETQDNPNETTTPDENAPTGESESNPTSGDETGSGESSSDTSSGGESPDSTSSGDSTDSNQGSDTSDSGEGSGESSPSGDGGESQN